MDANINTIGKRIAKAREDAGLSKSELARRVGATPAMVYKWETDRAKPRGYDRQKALAEALGVTMTWLNSGFGEQSAKVAEEKTMQIKAEQKLKTTVIVNGKDKRKLEDINLAINHIRDMNISADEMKAIYLTLVEIRTEVECKVLFNGMTA